MSNKKDYYICDHLETDDQVFTMLHSRIHEAKDHFIASLVQKLVDNGVLTQEEIDDLLIDLAQSYPEKDSHGS